MLKYFGACKSRMAIALCAMSSVVLLTTSCGGSENVAAAEAKKDKKNTEGKVASSSLLKSLQDDQKDVIEPPPVDDIQQFPLVDKPLNKGNEEQLPPAEEEPVRLPKVTEPEWGCTLPPLPPDVPQRAEFKPIELMVRASPASPKNERFLDKWNIEIFNIGDQSHATGPSYFGQSDSSGIVSLNLPTSMHDAPLLVKAYNNLLALECAEYYDESCEHYSFEILIPASCAEKAIWLLGPVENAIWNYYKEASHHYAEAWNATQVYCETWLNTLQGLILTDLIADALHNSTKMDQALITALQENPRFLTPTRPPICMAERRHNGGGMERADILTSPFALQDLSWDFKNDVITIGDNGIVDNLCGLSLEGVLTVNGASFIPTKNYLLDEESFIGTVHDHDAIVPNINASVFNVKLGNGRELGTSAYDDACALSSLVEFRNTNDDEQDIKEGSGLTFTNLFGGSLNTNIYLTSDGDSVVDDHDTWAIFSRSYDFTGHERVLAVELLGHRQEDFRDVLALNFDSTTDNLTIGLRKDYELNEEEVDGEKAYLAYTIHVWDGSTEEGRYAMMRNAANCLEAADPWARQFFNTKDLETKISMEDGRSIDTAITPLRAAEFAVRSQCFSNSRANQRWQADEVGYWSMNSIHGVSGNVIVNPGWLAPDQDFELYIQKFDEAVFKGPRTIKRSDSSGQLMVEMPTLVEGDRVLIKAEDHCCSDYEVVIPCVPEFTGFSGLSGYPYIPYNPASLVPIIVAPAPGNRIRS